MEETLDVTAGMDGEDRFGIELNAVQMHQLEAGEHALAEMFSLSEQAKLLEKAQAKHVASQLPGPKTIAGQEQEISRQHRSLKKMKLNASKGVLLKAIEKHADHQEQRMELFEQLAGGNEAPAIKARLKQSKLAAKESAKAKRKAAPKTARPTRPKGKGVAERQQEKQKALRRHWHLLQYL